MFNRHFPLKSTFLLCWGLLLFPSLAVGAPQEKALEKVRLFLQANGGRTEYKKVRKHTVLAIEIDSATVNDNDIAWMASQLRNVTTPIYLRLDYAPKVSPKVLRDFATISQLKGLSFHNGEMVDADLKPLAKLITLQELTLDGFYLTAESYAHFADLRELRVLNISYRSLSTNCLTDASLKHVGKLTKLREAGIGGPGMTDAGMKLLQQLTGLEKLTIKEASISRQGYAKLAALKNLKEIHIEGTPAIIYDALHGIAAVPNLSVLSIEAPWPITAHAGQALAKMKSLKKLSLDGATDEALAGLTNHPTLEELELFRSGIGDKGLAHLQNLPNLKWLSIVESKVTDAGVTKMSLLPKLQGLEIRGTHQFSDKSLAHLGKFKNLKRIELSEGQITGKGFSTLANLTQLESLDLSGNPITHVDAKVFARLKKLRYLNLTGSRLPDQTYLDIKQLIPDCDIFDYAGDFVSLEPKKDPLANTKFEDLSKVKSAFQLPVKTFLGETKDNFHIQKEQYHTKVVEITGVILEFGTEPGKGHYIKLHDPAINYRMLTCYTGRDQCWLDYTPGQKVTVKGRVQFRTRSPDVDSGQIIKSDDDPIKKADSVQFAKEFTQDSHKAELKYAQTWLQFEGEVLDFSFSSSGKARVVLKGDGVHKVEFVFRRFKDHVKKTMRVGKTAKIKASNVQQMIDDQGKKRVVLYDCYPAK